VHSLTAVDSTTSLTITECDNILSDAALGDSISVNGACLTITELDRRSDHSSGRGSGGGSGGGSGSGSFTVGVAPETMRRTNLGSLQSGGQVNLERSMAAATRIGGHFVQGHVDTVAAVVETRPDGDSLVMRLRPRERRVLRNVVEKGYVALDGASLTVTAVEDGPEEKEGGGWFEIMLIAYTQQKVVTARKREGDQVNLEIDMVGKYVDKSVRAYFEDNTDGGGTAAVLEKMVERIVAQKMMAMKQ
jgi:riboflavin synthase